MNHERKHVVRIEVKQTRSTKYVLLLIAFKQQAINREKAKAVDIMPLPKQGA